jgi:conjugal transfer pilus assembly protein TraB
MLSKPFNSARDYLQRLTHPETASEIRKLQILRVAGVLVVLLGLTYGVVTLCFSHAPADETVHPRDHSNKKPQPTHIETASSKVNSHEMWRFKVENENKKLREDIAGIKNQLNEAVSKNKQEGTGGSSTRVQELEDKILDLESQLQSKLQSASSMDSYPPNQMESLGQDQDGRIIQKFTLGLSESLKHRKLKTVDTTIPAGAFARTILLSGLDASAAMNASSDPRPMLLRIIDPGTLPRRFQSDLKDCHCTASAFGDLSSERIYARLEKLTCIERKTGEIIETQVAGYVAGPDGKAGIRGIVASKDGQYLGRSLVGGLFAGLSNIANPQNRRATVNPFFPGASQVAPPSIGENFISGMSSGATSALDRLSQYYIDRAEQLQPVIQVAAGQEVDIVFTEGTFIGSQSAHSDARSSNQNSEISDQK